MIKLRVLMKEEVFLFLINWIKDLNMVSKFYIAGLERGQIQTNGQYTGKYMLFGGDLTFKHP